MMSGMNNKPAKRIALIVLRTMVKRQGFRAFKVLAQGIKLVSRGTAPFAVYTASSTTLAFLLSPPVMIALIGYDAYKSLSPSEKEQLQQAINDLVAQSRVKYEKTRKAGHE